MLFTLFETFVLIFNAFAILNDKRFLSKYGLLQPDPNHYMSGGLVHLKNILINWITTARTLRSNSLKYLIQQFSLSFQIFLSQFQKFLQGDQFIIPFQLLIISNNVNLIVFHHLNILYISRNGQSLSYILLLLDLFSALSHQAHQTNFDYLNQQLNLNQLKKLANDKSDKENKDLNQQQENLNNQNEQRQEIQSMKAKMKFNLNEQEIDDNEQPNFLVQEIRQYQKKLIETDQYTENQIEQQQQNEQKEQIIQQQKLPQKKEVKYSLDDFYFPELFKENKIDKKQEQNQEQDKQLSNITPQKMGQNVLSQRIDQNLLEGQIQNYQQFYQNSSNKLRKQSMKNRKKIDLDDLSFLDEPDNFEIEEQQVTENIKQENNIPNINSNDEENNQIVKEQDKEIQKNDNEVEVEINKLEEREVNKEVYSEEQQEQQNQSLHEEDQIDKNTANKEDNEDIEIKEDIEDIYDKEEFVDYIEFDENQDQEKEMEMVTNSDEERSQNKSDQEMIINYENSSQESEEDYLEQYKIDCDNINILKRKQLKEVTNQLFKYLQKGIYLVSFREQQICVAGFNFQHKVNINEILNRFTGYPLKRFLIENEYIDIPAEETPSYFQLQVKIQKNQLSYKNFEIEFQGSYSYMIDNKVPLIINKIEFLQRSLTVRYGGQIYDHQFQFEHKYGYLKQKLFLEQISLPKEKTILFEIADKYIGKELKDNINKFGESMNLTGDLEIDAVVKNDKIALSFNLRKQK